MKTLTLKDGKELTVSDLLAGIVHDNNMQIVLWCSSPDPSSGKPIIEEYEGTEERILLRGSKEMGLYVEVYKNGSMRPRVYQFEYL